MLYDTRNLDVNDFLKRMIVDENALETERTVELGDVWRGGKTSYRDMGTAFVTEMNRQELCPGFEFYAVVDSDGRREGYSKSPTIALRKRDANARSTDNLPAEAAHCPKDVFDWTSSELAIVFVADNSADMYHSSDEDRIIARWVTERLRTYWGEHAERQHRTHMYQLLVFGTNARLLRYARDGITSSKAFNYVDTPGPLAEFFTRYSLLDDGQRGWDTSVQLADSDQADLFERKIRGWIGTVQGRKNLPNYEKTFDCSPAETYKLVVPFGEDNHTLLIRRPFFYHPYPFGRATRGYLAYDIEGDTVVFMKDAWRTCANHVWMSETEVYGYLEKYGVPFLPTVLFAGDVTGYQGCTQVTDHWALTVDAVGYETRLAHYRLIQRVAIPLAAALSPREYILAMYDALFCLKGAYDKAQILHGDVSLNNIMIDPTTGKGLLNDWDLCTPVTPDAKEPVEGRGRRGTPGYMSLGVEAAWIGQCKVHTIYDDLESFGWSMVTGALRYFLRVEEEQERSFHLLLDGMGSCKTTDLGRIDWLLEEEWLKEASFGSAALYALVESFTEEYGRRLGIYYDAAEDFTPDECDDGDLFGWYMAVDIGTVASWFAVAILEKRLE